MVRPFAFDYALNDVEDDQVIHLVVESESEDTLFVFDKKLGTVVQLTELPEIDQSKIRQRIEEHWFMNDAISCWSAD